MKAYAGHKIQGIIDLINKTQSMIDLHQGNKDNDPVSVLMVKQYQGIKRTLFKELLAELMLADLSFKDVEQFVQRLTTYLKKSDEAVAAPKELKSNLVAMERLMAV